MELEQIKTMIERALADRRLSRLESDSIKAAIYSDKKVTPEEAELFRHLQEQIWNGDVIIED
jgi:hypothetical protein